MLHYKLKIIIDGKSEIIHFASIPLIGDFIPYEGRKYMAVSLNYDTIEDCRVVKLKRVD